MKCFLTISTILFLNAAMANQDEGVKKADAWLKEKGLNDYGDTKETMYMGGTPLFNEMTGIQKDRLEYLNEKFPDKPWKLSIAESVMKLEKADAWLKEKGLNDYGDTKDTMYMGGTPLFNEMTGIQKDRLEYLNEKFPDKPWEISNAE
jgi:hypothetical protein